MGDWTIKDKPPKGKRDRSLYRDTNIEQYCCIGDCNNTAERSHLITQANLPKSQRHNPVFYIWLCRKHHTEQHKIGFDTFSKKYGVEKELEKARVALVNLRATL